MRKKLIYTTCITLISLLFLLSLLYFFFPKDLIKKKIDNIIKEKNAKASFECENINPLIYLRGIKFKNVLIKIEDNKLFEAEEIIIAYDFSSIFSFKTKVNITIKTLDGLIKFKAKFNVFSIKEKFDIQFKVDDASVKEIYFLKEIIKDIKLSGRLNALGRFEVDNKKINNALLDFNILENEIFIDKDFLPINKFVFDIIKSKVFFEKGKILIKEGIFKGEILNGEFDGTIDVKKPFDASIINIDCIIMPKKSYFEKNKTAEFLYISILKSKNMNLKIRGTLKEPKISII